MMQRWGRNSNQNEEGTKAQADEHDSPVCDTSWAVASRSTVTETKDSIQSALPGTAPQFDVDEPSLTYTCWHRVRQNNVSCSSRRRVCGDGGSD
eukprot:scaffold107_cov54-Attheya_sp.AAC.2